ncbi:MAG: hypothetical protein MRJ68_19220 [Nitrospira sp.]|nr:hypothetical protein [Nitrospira sp.]
MSAAPTTATASPYPYSIQIPKIDQNSIKQLDLWAALEFFRIEALIRSKEVQRLYLEGASGETLYRRHGILWDMLEGWHHHLLRSHTLEGAGIVDLDCWNKIPARSAMHVLNPCRDDDPSRFLHLQIDCAVPPTTVVKALMPVLTEKHRRISVSDKDSPHVPWPRHPKKRPPIHDVVAWISYFRCYDLRQCQGISFGKIAAIVFGPVNGKGTIAQRKKQGRYDQAERGYKSVKRLIKAAVEKKWPPDLSS